MGVFRPQTLDSKNNFRRKKERVAPTILDIHNNMSYWYFDGRYSAKPFFIKLSPINKQNLKFQTIEI